MSYRRKMVKLVQKGRFQAVSGQVLLIVLLFLSGCERPPDKALGTLEWDRVNGRAPASEVITNIYVREGDRVEAGTLLLTLDDRKIVEQLRELEAKKEQAAWQLRELETGPRPQMIAEARARLQAATATMENDSEEYQRQKQLFEADFASRQLLDNALNKFLNSKERVTELKENLDMLLVGTRMEQLEQARYQLASISAQISALTLVKNDFSITAAREGLVDSLPFKKGDKPPQYSVVSTLLAGKQPWARVYIPETNRSRMKPGDEYKLVIDGQDQLFTVRLRTISSEASFTPYFALSEKDRSRLSYVAELDVLDKRGRDLTAGTPVQLLLGGE